VMAVSLGSGPYQRVVGKVTANLLAQYPRTLAVNHPDPIQAAPKCGVQKLIEFRDSLIYREAVEVNLVPEQAHILVIRMATEARPCGGRWLAVRFPLR